MKRTVHQNDSTSAEKTSDKKNPWGTDSAGVIRRGPTEPFEFSFWDLWFALVVERKFDGDPEALRRELKNRRQKSFLDRERFEAKLSHLYDLRQRLAVAELEMRDIVAAAADLAAAGQVRRAWSNVVEGKERRTDQSEVMRVLPRERGWRFALRGYWPQFPVSPEEQAERLSAQFKTHGFYSCNASFGIARKFDRETHAARKLIAKGRPRDAFVRLRALLTVILEVIEMADDSCGVIGDSFAEAFELYLALPPDQVAIDQSLFLHDLLTLAVWEDYGFIGERVTEYLAQLGPRHREIAVEFLERHRATLLEQDLDYQAERAAELLRRVWSDSPRASCRTKVARSPEKR